MSRQEAEQMTARRVLALVLAMVLTVAGIQLMSTLVGGDAFAQTAPTPTSTGPSIEFLNPSKSTSLEVSDKPNVGEDQQGVNGFYHLNSWVGQVPADPRVEFEIEDADGVTTTIGQATRRGHDTFDFFWDLDSPEFRVIEDGEYTLRAILYNGAAQVDTDEEAIVINRTDEPPTDPTGEERAETAEITYPTNAGALGYFVNEAGSTSFLVDATLSSDTTFFRVFYATTPPGDEPQFKGCGSGFSGASDRNTDSTNDTAGSDDGDQVRARCTLASNERGSFVTAVAVVTNDTPSSSAGSNAAFNDSSDAHRVFPYQQDPTTLTVTPETQKRPINSCSERFTATVLDQASRPIPTANVDVHAQGPSDQLRFDTSTGSTGVSGNKPPDEGAHSSDTAYSCSANENSGTQGEHNVLSGPDLKHIESTSGTDDNGSFTFRLYSDAPGTTQITAWADENGDDLRCTAEASDNAAILWYEGNTAPSGDPTVSGVGADQLTCDTTPRTSPPPASSTTTRPPTTAPATTSPANSPTTARPTSPTAGTTTTSGPVQRTLTLAADKAKMPAGRQVTFTGQLSSSNGTCVANELVQIRRRILGTTEFTELFGTGTDSQGRFSVTQRARKSAEYIAVAPAHDNCAEATSNSETVLVKVILQILPSDKTPDRGDRIRIKSSVKPQHDGTELLLQRKRGGRWVTIKRTTMNNRSIGNFFLRANWNSRTFRTRWVSQDEDHEGNVSRPVTFRTQ